jgi:16S rRNA (cytidine1402-2'-O)-methyltransferase
VTAGVLYLAPVLLGAADPSDVLPAGVQSRIRQVRHFIAEQPKGARAFLKAIGHPGPLAALAIERLAAEPPPGEIERLLAPVRAGTSAAVLSEAGAPGVADPGGALVRAAHAAGIRVVPLVGPSSLLLALMASGLEGQRFAFHGYLPVPESELAQRLKAIEADSRHRRCTAIFIETPYRNDRMLAAIVSACADDTLLCVATALTLADEAIATRTVAQWRSSGHRIGKRPTVFLLLAAARRRRA